MLGIWSKRQAVADMEEFQVTALLTDEAVAKAAEDWACGYSGEEEQNRVTIAFHLGSDFARAHYEAREKLWRKLLNHIDEQVIDNLDADGSCYLCKELRLALGIDGSAE